MASAYEIFSSRDGGVRGTFGAQDLHRRFHLVVDAVTDDPVAVLPLVAGGTSIGAPHPWDDGAYAIGMTPIRLAPKLWEVDVLYGPPLVVDPARPWDIDIDVSLETYTNYIDLNNQIIGPAVYHPVPTDEFFPSDRILTEVQRLRDKRHFDTDGPTYYAPTPEGDIALYRIRGDKRRAVGYPTTRKVATFTISKRVPNLTAGQISSAMYMVNMVNKTTFYGAKRSCAKFMGMQTRSAEGTMDGQQTTNIVFDLSLVFAIDWDGHNPSYEYDIYEHSDGTQGMITDSNNKPIRRSYKLYEEAEFNTLLARLDS